MSHSAGPAGALKNYVRVHMRGVISTRVYLTRRYEVSCFERHDSWHVVIFLRPRRTISGSDYAGIYGSGGLVFGTKMEAFRRARKQFIASAVKAANKAMGHECD